MTAPDEDTSTSHTLNQPQARSTKPRPPSFFARLLRSLVPCVSPTQTAHPIEIDPIHELKPTHSKQPVQPESPSHPPNGVQSDTSQPDQAGLAAVPKPATPPPPSTPVAQAALQEEAVVVHTPQLLPPEETEGVTSGSVQAPGSSGGSAAHEIHHTHTPATPSTHSRDAEDSEATSFTDDEEIDDANPADEEEDEEDRLIINGGAGIPIGADGMPKPLLPPISPLHVGRKCLVLDLDETLVHSSFKSIQQADYVVPVEIEYHWHNVYVIKRPGVDNFLKKMGEIYEVVVFTASLSKYADPVLDKLDIHQVVSHRLFRESCYNHKGNYVKDLSQLGRPIADTIILDNSPASYIFHPNNAVPVSSWFNDPHDTELTDLVPFLSDLCAVDDIRGVLDGAR